MQFKKKTEAGKLQTYYIDWRTGTAHKVLCKGKNRSEIKTTVNVLIKWKQHRQLFYVTLGKFVDLITVDSTVSLVKKNFKEFPCFSINLIASIYSSRSPNIFQKSKILFVFRVNVQNNFTHS